MLSVALLYTAAWIYIDHIFEQKFSQFIKEKNISCDREMSHPFPYWPGKFLYNVFWPSAHLSAEYLKIQCSLSGIYIKCEDAYYENNHIRTEAKKIIIQNNWINFKEFKALIQDINGHFFKQKWHGEKVYVDFHIKNDNAFIKFTSLKTEIPTFKKSFGKFSLNFDGILPYPMNTQSLQKTPINIRQFSLESPHFSLDGTGDMGLDQDNYPEGAFSVKTQGIDNFLKSLVNSGSISPHVPILIGGILAPWIDASSSENIRKSVYKIPITIQNKQFILGKFPLFELRTFTKQ